MISTTLPKVNVAIPRNQRHCEGYKPRLSDSRTSLIGNLRLTVLSGPALQERVWGLPEKSIKELWNQ